MIVTYITEAGGVGKTTLCYNLGWHLANEGKKVLLVDADPQNTNVTRMAGFTKEQKDDMAGLVDILNGDVDIKETIIKLSPKLSIIPDLCLRNRNFFTPADCRNLFLCHSCKI
jgi:cellulose biosynthesis protein BcsQ